MKKLLYITAHPLTEENSVSLQVGKEFLETYEKKNPDVEIVKLDLYKENIPLLDADVLSAWFKLDAGGSFESLTNEQQVKFGRISQLATQFAEADRYVFVNPMWNFSYPAVLKAYIDTIVVKGITMDSNETGSFGLLEGKGKKAVHILASGNIYSDGPNAESEHANSLLKTTLVYLGVTEIDSIFAEGTAIPDLAEGNKQAAIKKAHEVAENLEIDKKVFQ
ncbi:FMN-dependent NADH-azoreductase [Chengkuizengella sediminis]|uniref:FMN-dependent NADH-azoreductase n=1 Tax=Chengkuizengella sediminis TaxID=1885917 RepID=UPI00138997B2|nr:FMN-dependent NADH-azoreductase [Chengkuizengella sediminis]NDI35752.1 FMN-dependent NADH-azoreductase [Chengkuizengella sediminis]